jgi:hypothetical protein
VADGIDACSLYMAFNLIFLIYGIDKCVYLNDWCVNLPDVHGTTFKAQ